MLAAILNYSIVILYFALHSVIVIKTLIFKIEAVGLQELRGWSIAATALPTRHEMEVEQLRVRGWGGGYKMHFPYLH
jgi:hypothetical protein